MATAKPLTVFGTKVEILVDGEMSRGVSAVVLSTVPPGVSLPPHTHSYEDEIFMALEGDFEIFEDGAWKPMEIDEAVFSARGTSHSYRNVGKEAGRIASMYAPAGIEQLYEDLDGLALPKDAKKIQVVFADYGLTLDVAKK
jgi:quercetin dioxygenase-like cupin family protein